ncbi:MULTISPECIES: GAF and ANTAR domain-containing protein [Nocardioides]|uniref:GAF and ANTAR domain-containing protein n=1 Tax=Nocardioides vastitatis TaxID=2568655 RepID=A0ABW0ZF38_9ACTN|nr:GAF and ANTAR domain-containing protein [Nocardioides sp.]THJ05350.1 GAF and ANTAR domain-containing protein [Nocardioides sp.]
MIEDHDDVATALTQAAKAIHSPRSLDETLDAIVHAAQQTVPGFEHVGISIVHSGGKIETRAGTGQLVWELDDLQYRLHEGPCFDSIRSGPVMLMADSRTEERWGRYLPAALAKGLRSQMGLRLYTDDGTLGGLNFYSTASPGIDPDALQLAELFAAHAAIALGRARYEHQLNESVASRQVIGTAVGIIMERYQISDERAFQFLVRASTTSNIKLRAIAQEIVDTANEKHAALPTQSNSWSRSEADS